MAEFEEVYNLYFKDVYRYALSLCKNEMLAEELTQETFFKALKGIDSFDGTCKLYVWLCQIAKNTYFSVYKKGQRTETDADLERLASAAGPEEDQIKKAEAFELHKRLHTLAEPYKEVFSLRLFGELSFAQIAELFGKTESWARVTYHRARLKMKEDLS
ncbi:sigma-70 family RNA polymerase sigma factor [Oscillibacter sp.]|uniref:RNA polymerase sigma factor n=1 Tax=Oscillibacter sp. TaxID=1945593 RepID=UPI0026137A7B|nr:sigma-70 family RNA polymerase sigma factor [Oscillibacter sp.]MDD3347176.1 sigma-70 family RNA polymerase sigma factor [Oscillibacter sp.]